MEFREVQFLCPNLTTRLRRRTLQARWGIQQVTRGTSIAPSMLSIAVLIITSTNFGSHSHSSQLRTRGPPFDEIVKIAILSPLSLRFASDVSKSTAVLSICRWELSLSRLRVVWNKRFLGESGFRFRYPNLQICPVGSNPETEIWKLARLARSSCAKGHKES